MSFCPDFGGPFSVSIFLENNLLIASCSLEEILSLTSASHHQFANLAYGNNPKGEDTETRIFSRVKNNIPAKSITVSGIMMKINALTFRSSKPFPEFHRERL